MAQLRSSLKQLEIVLIGPEMSSHDSVLLKSRSEKNREIVIRSMRTAYETFVMDDTNTPDLIIVLVTRVSITIPKNFDTLKISVSFEVIVGTGVETYASIGTCSARVYFVQ